MKCKYIFRVWVVLMLSVQTLMAQDKVTHVVFVTGDEEYRSEESMPMLAQILKRELKCKVTVLYALDDEGYINPNVVDNIPGLEVLEQADMMVLFTRYRALPDAQAQYILDFAESGKPMVGFRTSTHAFKYENDPQRAYRNDEWPIKVFGQKWITHHGHFGDGHEYLTKVDYSPSKQSHPILKGVKPFKTYSWLYHVHGKTDRLPANSEQLLVGRSLKSQHERNGNLDTYPLTNPVAWTRTYTGTSGKASRVFFTTLGHPFDFKDESMRKLALNGMFWALGLEGEIPKDGINAPIEGAYEPNNSGFGEKFKKGRKPSTF